MKSFKEILQEKSKSFGVERVIKENDMTGGGGGAMNSGTGQSMDSEAPAPEPSMDASPTPDQGAGVNTKPLEKPYRDLAEIAYKAFRRNFEDLGESQQNAVLRTNPEDIKSDEQGLEVMTAIEKVLQEADGVTPEIGSTEVGPGV